MNPAEGLAQKATGAVKWSASMELVSRVSYPVVFVLLARLLTPEDFGVMTTALVAISFAQMFWDAGLSKFLVQTNQMTEKLADVVFWTNITLAVAIYAVLFVCSPRLADFFNSPGTSDVLRVLGLQIIIASLSAVHQALLVREFQFRRLFWVRLAIAIMPGLISVPLASLGYGVWALVAGALAGQVLNLILLWRCTQWRPRARYDFGLARSMFSFGMWILLESFCGWLIMWGDSLIAGKYLGVYELGVYRTGWMVVAIIFGLALNPLLPVVFPAFSRLQENPGALTAAFHKVNRLIIAVALPMGVGLLVMGPELANILFGSKWQGLGLVVSVIGLRESISWLVGINGEVLRGMGRPDIASKMNSIPVLYCLPIYYCAAQYGLEIFVYARMGVTVITLPLHIYLIKKAIVLSRAYLWQQGDKFFISSFITGLLIYSIKNFMYSIDLLGNELTVLLTIAIAGPLLYFTNLIILDRDFVFETSRLVRRSIET